MFNSFRKAVSLASEHATDIAGKAKSTLGSVATEVSERAGAVSSYGAEQVSAVSERASGLMEEYRPTVERVVVDGLLTIALDSLRDDAKVRGVMESAYELLPAPVRLVLSRERYLKFVLDNRDGLVLKASTYQVERTEALRISMAAETQARGDVAQPSDGHK